MKYWSGIINQLNKKDVVSHPAKIPLGQATLCMNCDTVFNWTELECCPNCTSKNMAYLTKWLSMFKN